VSGPREVLAAHWAARRSSRWVLVERSRLRGLAEHGRTASRWRAEAREQRARADRLTADLLLAEAREAAVERRLAASRDAHTLAALDHRCAGLVAALADAEACLAAHRVDLPAWLADQDAERTRPRTAWALHDEQPARTGTEEP